MKPVNIFRVSRIRDERLFNIMEKHEASDHDNHRIRIHEIDSLRILTDALAGHGITVKDTDGFYFGFVIPLIGKEFDLLKVIYDDETVDRGLCHAPHGACAVGDRVETMYGRGTITESVYVRKIDKVFEMFLPFVKIPRVNTKIEYVRYIDDLSEE